MTLFDDLWFIAIGVDLLTMGLLIGTMMIAVLAGLRLWLAGRRAAGVLGALGASMVGVASFLMPVELAFFAAMDSSRRTVFDMLEEVFEEPWFLMAWAGLMGLSALPALLSGLALWLALPRVVDAGPEGPVRSPHDQGQSDPVR